MKREQSSLQSLVLQKQKRKKPEKKDRYRLRSQTAQKKARKGVETKEAQKKAENKKDQKVETKKAALEENHLIPEEQSEEKKVQESSKAQLKRQRKKEKTLKKEQDEEKQRIRKLQREFQNLLPAIPKKPKPLKATLQFENLQIGQVVKGRITKIEDYGVFIRIKFSKSSGLAHCSQMGPQGTKFPPEIIRSHYQVGDKVKAIILSIDSQKRTLSFGLNPKLFPKSEQPKNIENEIEDTDILSSDDDIERIEKWKLLVKEAHEKRRVLTEKFEAEMAGEKGEKIHILPNPDAEFAQATPLSVFDS